VLPALERHHEVLALTLPGHAGGSSITGEFTIARMVDQVAAELEQAGLTRAHLVGNSLGGHIALQLAARGRADTVVALAPAGGWSQDDDSWHGLLAAQGQLHHLASQAAPQADLILASGQGRRRATRLITTNFEHIPPELLGHQMRGIAACSGAEALIEQALVADWALDVSHITCPVRILWGAEDLLLPWPRAATRLYSDWLPHAEWVILDGVGHCPQLDVPIETAQLILGMTRP
jgi:pimeloyl-ACP methyl ester carboxylesterase